MSSKARTLVKSSILRIFEFFANAIVGIIMMPFIIHSLGDKMYGLWIFVGSFLGYYGLMDFGLNSAVQRFISRAIGISDHKEINKVINTSLFIFIIIGLVALIISFGVAFIVPLLIKNITESELFRKVILILGLNFAIGFPLRVFSGILYANLRQDISAIIELIKLAVRTILIIVSLNMGYGIMALAWITFAMDIGGYLVKYFLTKKLYKYIHLSRSLIDKTKIKPLFSYSVFTFISQIADQLRFNLDNLIIVTFIGLSSVTLYSIGSRLIRYFSELIGAAVGMLSPVFSQYEGSNNYQLIREKFILTTKISSYLSIMISGILIIFSQVFIKIWMGEDYLSAYSIVLILCIPITFSLMQTPTIQLLFGISKHKFFAISNTIEGIANLILSLLLVKKFGIIGVALGTAIPMIITKLFIQPIYTCLIIKLDIRKYYWENIILVVIKASAIYFVIWYSLRTLLLNRQTYFTLLILISYALILYSISIFIFGFSRNERNYFKKIFKPKC